MDEESKKQEIKKVPTRKLLASIKQDIRKTLNSSFPSGKSMKKK
jgi:predicted component of type VI protein secretion system